MEGAQGMEARRRDRNGRPSAERLFAAAVDLVSRGGSFKGTARRYSLCAQDAEDAYQRGLEILITKGPTDDRSELGRWLHTVIKHEALAIRRQRERLLGGEVPEQAIGSAPDPQEGAAERERTRRTAEALGELKQSEVQCLLLKALGYSYDEIAERTGYSWTKVNRSLTEGRRRLNERFAQIESGRRCRRFQPLLSAACDGEARPDDERELRVHLRGCQSCRALLRGYRAAPARLAELVPPTLLVPALARPGWWTRAYDAVVVAANDRAAAFGWKIQQAGESVTAHKAAAVVASTAALAGGAAVERGTVEQHHRHRGSASASLERAENAGAVAPSAPATEQLPRPQEGGPPPSAPEAGASADSGPAEFGPEAAAESAQPAVEPAATTKPASSGFERGGGRASAHVGGEFGP